MRNKSMQVGKHRLHGGGIGELIWLGVPGLLSA